MADGFLGRWSRRKQDVREGRPVAEPPPPVPASAAVVPAAHTSAPLATAAPGAQPPSVPAAAGAGPAPAPAPSLEDAQALTPQSDFKPFVARGVAPEVRNLAMKKLFADPHFNVMDGLDIYIGDYTQPDPLPAGALRKMVSAHALGYFEHEKKQETDTSLAPAAQGASPAPRDDAGVQPSTDVAQSSVTRTEPGVFNSQPDPAAASVPDALARSVSHTQHDDKDAHLRLQPDDAAQPPGAGRGTA